MKAFVFSDLHASERQLHNFAQFFESDRDIDLIIFAGDAVNMGEPVGFIKNFIKVIEQIGLPFFWVPGNNDFGRSYYKLNAKFPSLEGRIVVIPAYSSVIPAEAGIQAVQSQPNFLDPGSQVTGRDDNSIKLTGVGGSPASWAGQYAGEKMVDKKSIAGSIFVSHTPPPGILVMNKYDFISPVPKKKFADSPLVHICGHFHSRWGCGYLGATKVINPGPLELGNYAILDTDTLKVKFERFDYGNSYRI